MKKQFEQLQLNLITFSQQDVITTSGESAFSTNGIYDGNEEWLDLSTNV